VFELTMADFHSDLFPTIFLQKFNNGFDFHPAVLASAEWVGYRIFLTIPVGNASSIPPEYKGSAQLDSLAIVI